MPDSVLMSTLNFYLCELHFHYGPFWRRSMADDDFWLSVALLCDLSPKLAYLHLRESLSLSKSHGNCGEIRNGVSVHL